MRNQSLETMLRVRHTIEPSEALNDQALGQIGLLLHTTCEARRSLNVDYGRIQPVLETLVTAASKQTAVRADILRAHELLAGIGRELMPASMQGDLGCPPVKMEVVASHLHLVPGTDAAAAA